ncbi:phosphodiesterase [Mesorhizobium australicum]|uniref:Calcineurin-like phosphoesterase n=1 Tax=Mesorhizobium australicum TaxID=536018 RepID=A0A1X7NH36_9HYPH|nr:phosphodiesterase [Mesorhizobium australicum]SMH37105.1 Calcineurin-like phosphoesterase [Mesorhizobium australicum]
MKIVLVSDLHLVAPGESLFGLDPLKHLEDCIADLNRHHTDADLVVFSGDLTNDGEASAYAALAERLADLAAPYRLMLGNHDDRAAFANAFPQAAMQDGFAQCYVDLPQFRAVLLDTLQPGQVEGRLCETRLTWLDDALEGGRDTLLFLHHPPFPIGVPSLDGSRLLDADPLLDVLRRHGNVRHIFAGHVHRFAGGVWRGIPFTTVRGTNHQSALELDGPHAVSFEAPAYALVLADGDGLVVHMHEFPT